MICKNCGAKYADDLISCPFCDAENTEEAYRRQKEYINHYQRKSNWLANLPERIVHKTGNAMSRVAILAVTIFVALIILASVCISLYNAFRTWQLDMRLEKESVYQEYILEEIEIEV